MGSQFNYSIFPLWTDLINLNGTFKSEGNSTFQRYSWLGISPYYDSSRLNTFSVEIRPDGKIITNYVGLNANYASVGITGNISSGEFEQISYLTGPVTTGMIQNWERTTANLCSTNVLSSPSCPGYYDAIAKITSTPSVSSTLASVESTPTTTTTITNDPVSPAAVGYSAPTAIGTVSGPTTSSTNSERKVSGPSLSMILGIVRTEQSRILAVEGSAVQQANEAGAQAASQATSLAESISSNAVSNSTSELTRSAGLPNDSVSVTGVQTSIDFSSRSVVKDVLEERHPPSQEPSSNTQRSLEVKREIPDNEISTGVTLAALAKSPPGFELYQIGMKDINFYQPKEIYKNQKVIDNQRVLRQLNGRSDQLHQIMIDQQYELRN